MNVYALYSHFCSINKTKNMIKLKLVAVVLVAAISIPFCLQAQKQQSGFVKIKTKPVVITTPDDALAELKNGNQRLLQGKQINTNYKKQIEETKVDQHPHSLILSCLDSRIPPEIVFDQGIGNVFVARVAGNIEDPNILGSMEFATKVKGTKLIVVMGHNKCGAVKGAIENAALGNLTQLVEQIKPAIVEDKNDMDAMITSSSKKNIEHTIADILQQSPVIKELVKEGKVKIIGAFYDITTGKVIFLN
jgi:carbonic anhydrase